MPPSAEQSRIGFAAGDPASFPYRGRMLSGLVVRTNPKRAVVRTDDAEFSVPYERLVPDPATACTHRKRIETVMEGAQ